MLPVVVRTTDEMLQLVRGADAREAALSLGVPQWKVIVRCSTAAPRRASSPASCCLARISGETAPLLFTAFGNQYWNSNILQPMANVPVVMYQYAGSPYESWQQLAWAGALVLTVLRAAGQPVARALLLRNTILMTDLSLDPP